MRTKKGIITSAKMTGTVSVTVHRYVKHPVYDKRYRKSKKFLADTGDQSDLAVGDTVIIAECKPLSKNKCFRIIEVVNRVPRVSEVKEEEAVEELTAVKKKEDKPVEEEKPAKAEAKEADEAKEAEEKDTPSDDSDS